jgi:hypothetical protein
VHLSGANYESDEGYRRTKMLEMTFHLGVKAFTEASVIIASPIFMSADLQTMAE